MPDEDLVMVALREAETFDPDDGRVADAGLDTAPPDLRTVPDEDLLDVFPMLIPPRIVPPDVRIALLPVFLVVTLFLSV